MEVRRWQTSFILVASFGELVERVVLHEHTRQHEGKTPVEWHQERTLVVMLSQMVLIQTLKLLLEELDQSSTVYIPRCDMTQVLRFNHAYQLLV